MQMTEQFCIITNLFCSEEEDESEKYYVEYDAGKYSPRLIQFSDLPPDTILIDVEDDFKRLEFARGLVIKTGQAEVSEAVHDIL